MTTPNKPSTETKNVTGLNDPILQELWAVKARLNREANYKVENIARRTREQRTHVEAMRMHLTERLH